MVTHSFMNNNDDDDNDNDYDNGNDNFFLLQAKAMVCSDDKESDKGDEEEVDDVGPTP